MLRFTLQSVVSLNAILQANKQRFLEINGYNLAAQTTKLYPISRKEYQSKTIFSKYHFHFHFTDEKTEVQGGKTTCLIATDCIKLTSAWGH